MRRKVWQLPPEKVRIGGKSWAASFEAIVAVAGIVSVIAAIPVAMLAVRYVRIFFGILTLAFGMLFHSFLFKFYNLTGGDTGIRVLRPTLLGQDWKELDKTAFLIGPFYYACLVLAVVLGLAMWRIVHSPFGQVLKAIRENEPRAISLGYDVDRYKLLAFVLSTALAHVSPDRLSHLGVLRGHRRRDPRRQHRPGRPRARLLDPLRRARLHDRARRLRQLLRPARRRVRVHLPEVGADGRDPVLALLPRRDARADRHCLPARPDGPGERRVEEGDAAMSLPHGRLKEGSSRLAGRRAAPRMHR